MSYGELAPNHFIYHFYGQAELSVEMLKIMRIV